MNGLHFRNSTGRTWVELHEWEGETGVHDGTRVSGWSTWVVCDTTRDLPPHSPALSELQQMLSLGREQETSAGLGGDELTKRYEKELRRKASCSCGKLAHTRLTSTQGQ